MESHQTRAFRNAYSAAALVGTLSTKLTQEALGDRTVGDAGGPVRRRHGASGGGSVLGAAAKLIVARVAHLKLAGGLCAQMPSTVSEGHGRCGEMWGDVGRCGDLVGILWGDCGEMAHLRVGHLYKVIKGGAGVVHIATVIHVVLPRYPLNVLVPDTWHQGGR